MEQICNYPSHALGFPTEASENKSHKVYVWVFPGSWAGSEAERLGKLLDYPAG